MPVSRAVRAYLFREAQALRERLRSVIPFDLAVPAVPAAEISVPARALINDFVERGRRDLDHRLRQYGRWLQTAGGCQGGDEAAQRMLTMIRLRATTMLSRFDLYADALAQRSEHSTGVWLAGLEALARDALDIPGAPPVVCYLDRGSGAAIRRAHTRLEGGEINPVALIRIPRERMVGSGVGSSLVHEVGHQGVALLDARRSVARIVDGFASPSTRAWALWMRWLGELLPDFWSVAHVGPTAVLGLMSVVSVPRPFVFRINADDPHPTPWIRVRLACAFANELFPHAQWSRLDELWQRLYPVAALDVARRALLDELSASLPALARLVAEHRPQALRGRTLRESLVRPGLAPDALAATFHRWKRGRSAPSAERPCRAMAVLGQAKAEARLSAAEESRMLDDLLTAWALTRTRHETESCARSAA